MFTLTCLFLAQRDEWLSSWFPSRTKLFHSAEFWPNDQSSCLLGFRARRTANISCNGLGLKEARPYIFASIAIRVVTIWSYVCFEDFRIVRVWTSIVLQKGCCGIVESRGFNQGFSKLMSRNNSKRFWCAQFLELWFCGSFDFFLFVFSVAVAIWCFEMVDCFEWGRAMVERAVLMWVLLRRGGFKRRELWT